jgi:lysophospholipase L1-like esterase
MQQILVYADSLSWGIIPNTRRRLEFDARWPGVLENELNANGRAVRVIEDCLNGRRTVWDDPFKPGRNGLIGLAQRIEINSPLALVIVMLGTNDFQAMHDNNAWLSGQGLAALIGTIRQAPIEPGMPVAPILPRGCRCNRLSFLRFRHRDDCEPRGRCAPRCRSTSRARQGACRSDAPDTADRSVAPGTFF